VTLTLGVAIQLWRSEHHLIMVIICAKLFKKKRIRGLKAMEGTPNVDVYTFDL
jgi:hypothetical protein